jgi:thiol-disulfide isomerase/thioredoxin
MTLKRLSIAVASLAIAVVVVIGLTQAHGSSAPERPTGLTVAQMQQQLAGSPPALASLHAQANEILEGGLPALRARLASVRGTAVVINKWASWCAPCRAEFGVFQRASVNLGRRVAFIGIDSGDTSHADAVAFLKSFPLSYPSYYDQDGQAGIAVTESSFTPVTVIYGAKGGAAHPYIRQGQYPSVAKLEADIQRYGLDG